MPASSVNIDDDASIARLLAEDARASSSRYAKQGLSALLPKRPAGSAPKANTRFLKALVRDADSHNAALRRKEDRERVERLRNGGKKPTLDSNMDDNRQRQGKGRDHDRDRKRRRLSSVRNDSKAKRDGVRDFRSRRRDRHDSDSRSRSRSRESGAHKHKYGRRRHDGDGTRSRHGQDSDSGERPERLHYKYKRHRSRSRSPRNGVSGDGVVARSPKPVTQPRRGSSSSDPLEELVGPLPAKEPDLPARVRVRGRGAHKIASTSNIDAHFSPKYDPSLDVHPEEEHSDEREDWEMALEAVRDRQAWKKKHADRLREAGFNDDEIDKWEDPGREKDARDVRWRSRGQVREWDIGKDEQPSNEVEDGRLSP